MALGFHPLMLECADLIAQEVEITPFVEGGHGLDPAGEPCSVLGNQRPAGAALLIEVVSPVEGFMAGPAMLHQPVASLGPRLSGGAVMGGQRDRHLSIAMNKSPYPNVSVVVTISGARFRGG